MEKLYDVTSSAEKLGGISPWTVRAWLSQGRLAKTKVGRRTMVSEAELERFVREQQASNMSCSATSHDNEQKPSCQLRGKRSGASLPLR